MASKFVAAVALLALCNANPVLINGILYRDGRAYSMGQATSYGSGVSTAQADVHNGAAKAFGSATGGQQLARDGYYYPGQAIAQAQTYEAPPFPESAYGAAKAVAQAQNGAYYPVPAPATVITYEQNFVPAASSVSHADSHGTGDAHSFAKTQGGVYGETSSNANSHGLGSADSRANSGFGSTSSSAKTHGEGSAASSAQNNGVAGDVNPVAPAVLADQPAPAVVDARTPIYYTSYVPAVPAQGVASANAQVAGPGHAASSAKIGQGQGRTISWRFGTFYDAPASAHAQANTHAGYGAAKSAAHNHGYGSTDANAAVNGYGSAKSVADNHYAGLAQSSANSHGAGSANANANVNSAGHGGARSSADVHGQYYGGSRSSADAHAHGSGSAASSAKTQGAHTALRVANSQAHSSHHGSAHANALSV